MGIEAIGLVIAAFAAGAINAVAGGGSLVSFPALLAAGYPAKASNVTNTVALWPGYLGGSWGYRAELRHQRGRVVALFAASSAGAVVGSAVLLWTPESTFDAMVPFLIYFACGVMIFQDPLSHFAQRQKLVSTGQNHMPPGLHVSLFVLSVYGAYFGAGLGIILLAALMILLPDDIHHSNALKGLLSALINAIAVVYFAFLGPVRWGPAVVMAVGALAGGYFGVGIARRLGRRWLRLTVIAYGLVSATIILVT